jgi:hypothetical protein
MRCSKAFTDALQFMWGDGLLSPGGPEEVAEMLQGHDIVRSAFSISAPD